MPKRLTLSDFLVFLAAGHPKATDATEIFIDTQEPFYLPALRCEMRKIDKDYVLVITTVKPEWFKQAEGN